MRCQTLRPCHHANFFVRAKGGDGAHSMSAHHTTVTPQSIQPLNIEEKSENCRAPALGAASHFQFDSAVTFVQIANWCKLLTLDLVVAADFGLQIDLLAERAGNPRGNLPRQMRAGLGDVL